MVDVLKLLELEKKAREDGSLTSRIPTWITAGDGRNYLHVLNENAVAMCEEILRLREALIVARDAIQHAWYDHDDKSTMEYIKNSVKKIDEALKK